MRSELWKESPQIYVSMICPGFINTNLSITGLKGDGSALGKKDETHSKGMPPKVVALEIIDAIEKKKREIYVGGQREKTAAYLHRYMPALFAKLIRTARVK